MQLKNSRGAGKMLRKGKGDKKLRIARQVYSYYFGLIPVLVYRSKNNDPSLSEPIRVASFGMSDEVISQLSSKLGCVFLCVYINTTCTCIYCCCELGQ